MLCATCEFILVCRCAVGLNGLHDTCPLNRVGIAQVREPFLFGLQMKLTFYYKMSISTIEEDKRVEEICELWFTMLCRDRYASHVIKMAAHTALKAGYSCRPWQKEDRDAVGEIIRVVLEEYGLPYEPLGEDEDALRVEDFYWQGDKGEFWLVLDPDGAVVGTSAFLQSNRGPKCVEIRKMYLLPRARGQGLGKALLQLMEERIKLRGYETMYVQTASVLREACSMYKKAGYRSDVGMETPRCDILLSKLVQSSSIDDNHA